MVFFLTCKNFCFIRAWLWFSATEKYKSLLGWPTWDARESLCMLVPHSLGLDVKFPTISSCHCVQCRHTSSGGFLSGSRCYNGLACLLIPQYIFRVQLSQSAKCKNLKTTRSNYYNSFWPENWKVSSIRGNPLQNLGERTSGSNLISPSERSDFLACSLTKLEINFNTPILNF